MTEERLDPGVVKAVAGTGHALDNTVFLQKGRILPASKLASLVRMQDQPLSRVTIQYGRMYAINDISSRHGWEHFVSDNASVI